MIIERTKPNPTLLTKKEEVLEGNFLDGGISSIPYQEKTFSKGDHIFRENDPSEKLYLIESGSVKVYKIGSGNAEIVKAILGPGNIFGEKAISGEEIRRENALVINPDTSIKSYKVNDILQAARQDEVLCLNIMKILGDKLEAHERRLESIISKDSRTRIVDFLRDMALESGRKVGFETLIKNNFTHKDIASLTGTSRQTVTTTLNSLKEQNIINFDRRRILIRDMDLLK